MDTIDRATLTQLAKHRGFPSVSLYLPTHRAGGARDEDRIRYKNLVRRAVDGLVGENMRSAEAERLLSQASALLEDALFWRDTGEGLAVFVEPAQTSIFRLDAEMPEQCVVGDRFYLRPLALAYHGDQRFFALVLDRNMTRLFEGDDQSITQRELDPSVASFAETAKYDSREEFSQFTTHASPESVTGSGRTIGTFHGQAAQNFDKNELSRWISALEESVSRDLGPETDVPLLLLGEMESIQNYRSVNSYRGLAAEQVVGAADYLTDRDVHAKALAALQPRFSAGETRDLSELDNKPSALVSSDPAEILSAAATGRVKTLFFDEGAGPYGLFDRNLFAVSSVCSAAPRYLRDTAESEPADMECGWDLVDLALAETVLHGGEFHAFGGENAPVSGVAAVLRY